MRLTIHNIAVLLLAGTLGAPEPALGHGGIWIGPAQEIPPSNSHPRDPPPPPPLRRLDPRPCRDAGQLDGETWASPRGGARDWPGPAGLAPDERGPPDPPPPPMCDEHDPDPGPDLSWLGYERVYP